MSRCFGALVMLALGATIACQTGPSGAPATRGETESEASVALPADVECKRILERSWLAIQPALLRLGIAPDKIERDYRGQLGSAFVEGCTTLRPAERRCLARAKNPALAVETCAINRERSLADRVQLPALAAHVTSIDPPPIAEREADMLSASLSGEWINVGADGKTNATWSFLPGARLRILERKANVEAEETFRVGFPARYRMTIDRPGGPKQDIALFRSRDALYVSRGLSYGVVPLVDRARFTLRHDTSYVFFGPEGCEVVADHGAIHPASCGFAKRPDGPEVFQVRQAVNQAHGLEVSYPIVDGHLLHERLASYGRFARKWGP